MDTKTLATMLVKQKVEGKGFSLDELGMAFISVYAELNDLVNNSETLESVLPSLASLGQNAKINRSTKADIPRLPETTVEKVKAVETRSVSGMDSIQKDYVMCLECGEKLNFIKGGHIVKHGLTTYQYKIRHGIGEDVKLASLNYIEKCRQNALKIQAKRRAEKFTRNNAVVVKPNLGQQRLQVLSSTVNRNRLDADKMPF